MGIKVIHRDIPTSTATRSIRHENSDTPKAGIIFTSGDQRGGTSRVEGSMGIGFFDGTRERCIGYHVEDATTGHCGYLIRNDRCYQLPTDAAGDVYGSFSSWDAEHVALAETNGSALDGGSLFMMTLAGKGVQAYVGDGTVPTSTGTFDITDPGFQPDLVLLAWTDQFTSMANTFTKDQSEVGFGWSWVIRDNVGSVAYNSQSIRVRAGNATSGQRVATRRDALPMQAVNEDNNGTIWGISTATILSNGFRLNVSTAPSTARAFIYIAIKGVQAKRNTGVTVSVSGVKDHGTIGFQPDGILYMGHSSTGGDDGSGDFIEPHYFMIGEDNIGGGYQTELNAQSGGNLTCTL